MATPMYVHLLHNSLRQLDRCNVARVTIDMLPDVALLEIFEFYEGPESMFWVDKEQINAWHTLVHVCRKWRNIVFGSPLRLNLRLYCGYGTPVRRTLSVWPLLPIIIETGGSTERGVDDIIAALEHSDRICYLALITFPRSQFEMLWEAMSQQPFPALTYLNIQNGDFETAAPVIPASFLGGDAPCLRTLTVVCIPFPGLRKLLLSTTHLVSLSLGSIPHSGYISPAAMVNYISDLTMLEDLHISFLSPRSCPDRRSRRPPPQIHTVLPVLKKLVFTGVSEYLEDLVARIDAPLLDILGITFFHQLIFDTPQLTRLISRTPNFKTHDEARIVFSGRGVSVRLPRAPSGQLSWGVSCRHIDWQLLSLAQACNSSLPQSLISTVEHLYLHISLFRLDQEPGWQDDIEVSQWLELLRPFTAAKDLYITKEFAPCIAPALKELAVGRVTEVLPALQTLFLEEEEEEEPPLSGPVQDMVGWFVTGRQLARSRWKNNILHE
jgi:hypothetical protein